VSGIVLRDYQEECVGAVLAGVARGVGRQLAISPTGSGKTVVFGEVIRRRHRPGGVTVVLAHRDELLKQAGEKLEDAAPELAMEIGYVKAKQNDVHKSIIVASVQTLARKSRREQLPPDIDTVIVDEAHHIVAPSYQEAIEWLNPDLLLGVTATAERADGKDLEEHFDEIVFARSIEWMVRHGYLCEPRGKRISVDVDLGAVKKSHGDFQADDLADKLELANTPDLVLDSWRDYASDRKTLIFAPNVAMAHRMAEVFCAEGIAAEAVDGSTPDDERAAILHRFHTGETRVLSNCAILTEGYDEPSVECIVLAAPTKSNVKYTQIVGRGLRLYPGKKDCLLLDVVGASEDNSIASLPALFGLRDLLEGESIGEARRRHEREDQEARDREAETNRKASEVKERKKRSAESIEFFDRDRMNWIKVSDCWAIALNGTETIVLRPLADGAEHFDVLLVNPKKQVEVDGERHKGSFKFLARGLDLGYAQGAAEETVRKHGSRQLVDSKAAWRSEKVSPKQHGMLRRFGIGAPDTRGEAADLIDQANVALMVERIDLALAERETRDRELEPAGA
jgi:superfamily II DNA or RNA helicase